MLLLKFAGLPYEENRQGLRGAPKGKLPYIEDKCVLVADSTFIRFHIEKKYGFDFDKGLTPEQKAAAWAVEKMCEEHLHFALVTVRWLDDANFAKGPAQFFKSIPLPLRPLVQALIRHRVQKTLQFQGFGRHAPEEQEELAIRDVNALATLIGPKSFLMGESPCGADATVFSFLAQLLSPMQETAIKTAAEKHENLTGYCDRMLRTYFPA